MYNSLVSWKQPFKKYLLQSLTLSLASRLTCCYLVVVGSPEEIQHKPLFIIRFHVDAQSNFKVYHLARISN